MKRSFILFYRKKQNYVKMCINPIVTLDNAKRRLTMSNEMLQCRLVKLFQKGRSFFKKKCRFEMPIVTSRCRIVTSTESRIRYYLLHVIATLPFQYETRNHKNTMRSCHKAMLYAIFSQLSQKKHKSTMGLKEDRKNLLMTYIIKYLNKYIHLTVSLKK